MAPIGIGRSESAPLNATLLLGLGGAASGLVAAALALWLTQRGSARPATLALSAGVALLIGLACALPLLGRLAQLDRALARLARGEVSPPAPHGWPLASLLRHAEDMGERVAQSAERERQALAYRAEVMRQVGEAAAREERNRLARELHDSIKQQLFSIGVSAAAARTRIDDSDGALAALDDIQRGAREAQVEMTALLQQLRPAPLENVGLVEALRDQCEALGYRTGAEVSVTIGELPSEDRLPPRAQEQLFRMAQEALANIARHARAQRVWLRLEREGDAMLLTIRDDGQGFESASMRAGMGVNNLRERARALGGSAEVESAPGRGTIVRIMAPLIEPLPFSPEEATRLSALVKGGERWLSLCVFTLNVAGGLLIFGMPFWSVALGLIAIVATYLLARRAWSEVVALAGSENEQALALEHRARECVAWLLIVLALCVWYLPASEAHTWGSGARLAGVAAGSTLLLALGVFWWERWRRATVRYYRLLPLTRRRTAIQRRWDETLSLLGTLAFVVVLGLLFGGWPISLPPHTPSQWSNTAGAALLALTISFGVIECWLVWRWRRGLLAAQRREASA